MAGLVLQVSIILFMMFAVSAGLSRTFTLLIWSYVCSSLCVAIIVVYPFFFKRKKLPNSDRSTANLCVENMLSRAKPILISLVVVVFVRVLNLVPRFIDRSVASFGQDGLVASIEYSFAFITLPVTLIYSAFLYTEYSKWKNGNMFIRQSLLICMRMFTACLFLTVVTYVLAYMYMNEIMGSLGIPVADRVLLVEVFLVHLLAVPFILTGMVLMAMLVVMEWHLWLLIAVFSKLAIKILLLYIAIPVPSPTQLAFTFVVVEIVLVGALLFSVCWRGNCPSVGRRPV